MQNPYLSLPTRAFWRTAVADHNGFELTDLYRKRFEIAPDTRVSAAGSCFAQHIGRQLMAKGFNYQDFEPAPPYFPKDQKGRYGYGIFSARYGNIYTARQLLQLVQRAYGEFSPTDTYWQAEGGRAFDPFRPTVEPDGFASVDELEAVRETHLAAVRTMFENTDVLVYTFGLTEVWINRADGAAYPMCPGTVAGTYEPNEHILHNLNAVEILADMEAFIARARELSPELKILLTVSPVPLTATASGQHALIASTYTKSVLRAVAGLLYQKYDFVDYFPGYEIVTSPSSRGMYYGPNMRNVSAFGVERVMGHFFAQHPAPGGTATDNGPGAAVAPTKARPDSPGKQSSDVVCDEERLDVVRG